MPRDRSVSPATLATILRAACLRDRLLRARRTLPACALIGATALQGCVAVGSSKQENPTLGRQLIDLKAALDAGAMTEAEYNSTKQQLLSAKR